MDFSAPCQECSPARLLFVQSVFQNVKQSSEDNHYHAVTAQHLNTRKHAFRRNSPFGVTASVFVHGSTCITIAISVNLMHIAIFNVGKEKRHFNTSKLTKSLSCNYKHKTYISTSNAINWFSHTPHGYWFARWRSSAYDWSRHGQTTVRRHKRRPHFSLANISVTIELWI